MSYIYNIIIYIIVYIYIYIYVYIYIYIYYRIYIYIYTFVPNMFLCFEDAETYLQICSHIQKKTLNPIKTVKLIIRNTKHSQITTIIFQKI